MAKKNKKIAIAVVEVLKSSLNNKGLRDKQRAINAEFKKQGWRFRISNLYQATSGIYGWTFNRLRIQPNQVKAIERILKKHLVCNLPGRISP